jgi:hypothetical protein
MRNVSDIWISLYASAIWLGGVKFAKSIQIQDDSVISATH